MAEFQMIAKNLERLCNTYRSLGKCGIDECPLYCENLCYARMMAYVHGDNAGRLEDVVMAWAAEHPEPVYPRWVDWLVKVGVLGRETRQGHDSHFVEEAMFEPIPADIAQKLGIEPK